MKLKSHVLEIVGAIKCLTGVVVSCYVCTNCSVAASATSSVFYSLGLDMEQLKITLKQIQHRKL